MTEEQNQPQQSLDIQRVYVKDLSLETPSTPQIFREEWKPEVSVDLDVKNTSIDKEIFEVVLSITVTAKMKDQTVFLVEAHQGGIFHIAGFNDEQQDHILNAYCPSVLFPYAREVVSELVSRASFPQFNLAPINFDMLYMQQKADQQKAQEEKSEQTGAGETTH